MGAVVKEDLESLWKAPEAVGLRTRGLERAEEYKRVAGSTFVARPWFVFALILCLCCWVTQEWGQYKEGAKNFIVSFFLLEKYLTKEHNRRSYLRESWRESKKGEEKMEVNFRRWQNPQDKENG